MESKVEMKSSDRINWFACLHQTFLLSVSLHIGVFTTRLGGCPAKLLAS